MITVVTRILWVSVLSLTIALIGHAQERISIEATMREVQARYTHFNTQANPIVWPTRPDGTPAPSYPADGFYGEAVNNPAFAAVLVQAAMQPAVQYAPNFSTKPEETMTGFEGVNESNTPESNSSNFPPTSMENYRSNLENVDKLIEKLDYVSNGVGSLTGIGIETKWVRNENGRITNYSNTTNPNPPASSQSFNNVHPVYGTDTFLYSDSGYFTADLGKAPGTSYIYLSIWAQSGLKPWGSPPVPNDGKFHVWQTTSATGMWRSPDIMVEATLAPPSPQWADWYGWVLGQNKIVRKIDWQKDPDRDDDDGERDDDKCDADCDQCPPGKGEHTNSSVRSVYPLGRNANGLSYGFISVHESIATDRLKSPLALRRSLGNGAGWSNQVIDGQNALRQVTTSDLLVDVVTLSSTSWSLRFYREKGPFSNGVYDQTGITPYQINVFESIYEPDGITYKKLVVTESGELSNRNYEYLWNGDGHENAWELVSTSPSIDTRHESVSKIQDSNVQRREIKRVRDGQGKLFSETETTFTRFGWGEEKTIKIQRGLSPAGALTGDDVTETWSYYEGDDVMTGARRSKLREALSAGGAWAQYTYTADGRVAKKRTPYLNAGPLSTDSECRVVEYSYLLQNLGGSAANEIVVIQTEKLLGHVVSRTFDIWWRDAIYAWPFPYEYRERWIAKCTDLTITDPSVAITANTSLITKERYDTWTHRKVASESPDGTMTMNEISGATTIVQTGKPDANKHTIADGTRSVTKVNSKGGFLSEVVTDIASNLVISQRTATTWDPFGRPTTFTYLGGGSSTQSFNCCGVETETDRQGITTSYSRDSAGRVLTQTRSGVTTEMDYDVLGRVKSTKRIAGGITTVLESNTYGCCGLESRSDAAGRVTSFAQAHDGQGQTIKTTILPGTGTRIETYARDGTLLSVSGTAAAPLKYEYGVDSEGAYVKEIRVGSAGEETEWTKTYTDGVGRPSKVVYPDAAYVESIYNNLGQLFRQVDADGVTTLSSYNTKGELEVTAIDMNRNGVIDYAGGDRVTRTLTSFLTANNTTVRRTTQEIWETDNADTPRTISITETSASGLNTWQVVNNLPTSTSVVYQGSGMRVETTTAPDTTQTIRQYVDDRLITTTVTNPGTGALLSTTQTYDPHGRLQTVTDARNGTTTYTYFDDDQVHTVTTPDPDTTRSGSGYDPQTTTYAYDSAGRLFTVTHPDTTVVTTEYYPTGLLKKTWGSRTYPQEYTYDSQGRTKTLKTWQNYSTDTGSATTTWNYDPARGWLLNKRYEDNQGPGYLYTSAGRLFRRTWARLVNGSPLTTTYGYNNAGDLNSVDYSDNTPDVAYTHDRLGRVLTQTDSTGTLTRTYHSSGQLQNETYGASGLLANQEVTRSFDALDRFGGITASPASAITLGYDPASRLQTVTQGAYSATYGYLANSSLVETLTQRNGATIHLTTTKSYDKLNRLETISALPSASSAISSSYRYNTANQREKLTREDSSYWDFAYDPLGQLTGAQKKLSAGTLQLGRDFVYTFDDIGNRKTASTNGLASTYTPTLLNTYSQRTVPGVFEVAGAAVAAATVTVTAPEPGGTVYTTQRQGEAFYQQIPAVNSSSPQNVPLKITGVLNNGGPNGEDLVAETAKSAFVAKTPEVFTHDADGNLTADGRWTYVWDAENRLAQIETQPAAVTAGAVKQKLEFAYDGQSRRVQKKVSTWNTGTSSYQLTVDLRFVYDGWNLLAERNGLSAGTLVRSYVWGSDLSGSLQGAGGVGGLLAVNSDGTTYSPAYDGNGNVVALISSVTGTIEASYEYSPFGEVIHAPGSASAATPFLFSSKYSDSETSLIYYGFRYHQPNTGRWLSRDPLGEMGGLSVYCHTSNAPTDFIDPFGLKIIDIRYQGMEPVEVYIPGEPTADKYKKTKFDVTFNVPYNYVVHLLCEKGKLSHYSTEVGANFKEDDYADGTIFKTSMLPKKIREQFKNTPISAFGVAETHVRPMGVSIKNTGGDNYEVELSIEASVSMRVTATIGLKAGPISLPFKKTIYDHVYSGAGVFKHPQSVVCPCNERKNNEK